MTALSGTIPALITPFDDRGELDLDAMRRHVAWLREHGIETVSALGSTGEGPSLSLDERRRVIEALAPEVGLVAGTGCTALPETIELSRLATEAGAALLVAPPSYYEADERGVEEFFLRLLESLPSEARVLLYHIPRFTGVPVSSGLLRDLLGRYGSIVAGAKDSSGDLEHARTWLAEFPDLAILNGSDVFATEHYAAGGRGTITMLANVFPEELERIRTGRGDGGEQDRLRTARALVAQLPEIAAVKHLAHRRAGLPQSPVRPPLRNLVPEERRRLDERL